MVFLLKNWKKEEEKKEAREERKTRKSLLPVAAILQGGSQWTSPPGVCSCVVPSNIEYRGLPKLGNKNWVIKGISAFTLFSWVTCSKAGFLSLSTIDILGLRTHVVGGCRVQCWMFRSIPGPYLPDANNTFLLGKPKMSPDIAKCPLESKITPSWEPLL